MNLPMANRPISQNFYPKISLKCLFPCWGNNEEAEIEDFLEIGTQELMMVRLF